MQRIGFTPQVEHPNLKGFPAFALHTLKTSHQCLWQNTTHAIGPLLLKHTSKTVLQEEVLNTDTNNEYGNSKRDCLQSIIENVMLQISFCTAIKVRDIYKDKI